MIHQHLITGPRKDDHYDDAGLLECGTSTLILPDGERTSFHPDSTTSMLRPHQDHYHHHYHDDDAKGDVRRLLRFRFQGYAIWLDLEQFPTTGMTTMTTTAPSSSPTTTPRRGRVTVPPHESIPQTTRKDDLDDVLRIASQEWGVVGIPAPHVTALYGIHPQQDEAEVRQRFHTLAHKLPEWPELEPLGTRADVEMEGVNGGQMNMTWMEVTFKTSQEHENCIDQVYQCFNETTDQTRSSPWCPHLSLAYDNEDRPIPSNDYLQDLLHRFPTLTVPRRVESLSLWNLNGTMDQWYLVDRIALQSPRPSKDSTTDHNQVR